jgi:hypothetical protein
VSHAPKARGFPSPLPRIGPEITAAAVRGVLRGPRRYPLIGSTGVRMPSTVQFSMFSTAGMPGYRTGGRSRTRNARFWKPLLYRIELHPFVASHAFVGYEKPPYPWFGVGGVMRVNALSAPPTRLQVVYVSARFDRSPERGYAGHVARAQPLRVVDGMPQHVGFSSVGLFAGTDQG